LAGELLEFRTEMEVRQRSSRECRYVRYLAIMSSPRFVRTIRALTWLAIFANRAMGLAPTQDG